LVLLRHGESEWNKSKRFTGWCDVALTAQGEEEAVEAGDVSTDNIFLVIYPCAQRRPEGTEEIGELSWALSRTKLKQLDRV